MLKLMGSVLIFGACLSLGLAAQQRLRQRIKAIEAMLSAIDYITAELRCKLTPLPFLLEALAASKDRGTAEIFKKVLEALGYEDGKSLPYKWCCIFKKYGGEVGLQEEEIGVLQDMSSFLGRYDAGQQITDLERTRARLMEIRTTAQEEARVRGNLYRSCGAAIGVMTVLILL